MGVITFIFEFLRYGLGSAMLFGVSPQFLALWAAWRGMSIALPGWLYQWGDDKLYSLYQRLVLFFFETCTGVEIIMYGDTEELLKRKENVLYMANHQSTVDWLVANMLAVRGGNIGHLRYVLKSTLQLIPLYGWYFYAHGCIYVRRGKFSQKKMLSALNYLKHDKINTWLVIFPEGTRYHPSTPATIQKSEQFSRDNNLTELQYHLVPKHRGTWLCAQHLYEKLDAVYDVSVFYEGVVDQRTGTRRDAPQLINFLMGRCPKVHVKVRRIPFQQVPREEESLKNWLHELFVQKDRLMRPFYTGVIHDDCELGRPTLERNMMSRRSYLQLSEGGDDGELLNAASNGVNCTDDRKISQSSRFSGSSSSCSSNQTFSNDTLRSKRNGKELCSNNETNISNDLQSSKRSGKELLAFDYDGIARHYHGSRSVLGVWETLPSFLVFGSISLSCFYFPFVRKIYYSFMCYGALGAYAWLAVRNVC